MQVKQAVVGYGMAEKRQVMDMVRRILHLTAVPRPDDAADAVAIALCHARSATSLFNKGRRPGAVFYYIEGVVSLIDGSVAVVDCGGVGYAVNTTVNFALAGPHRREDPVLYLHDHP